MVRKRKSFYFAATIFENTWQYLGVPYKDSRAENNGNQPRGVPRNVTNGVTQVNDDWKWRKNLINIQHGRGERIRKKRMLTKENTTKTIKKS